MELKYVCELLQSLYDIRYQQCGNVPAYRKSHEAEALQTAISHLETLQKVKETGGVKRRENVFRSNINSGTNYDTAYNAGWNDCLDAIHAGLAGKLEGLEGVIENCFIMLEKKRRLKQASFTFEEIKAGLTQAIQELFLGKKEE